MTEERTIYNKIALLATGDEILNGDILNTNAEEISQRLFAQGLQVSTHMSVGDHIAETKQAIKYLLQHHRAIIITGGLGPTTDDLTRFALAEALNRELIFDEPTWQRIVERLTQFGYATPPENNRQQALFPEGAVILPNSNGTAAGCIVKDDDDHLIFMLPGPPQECLPLVDKVVIPALKIANFKHAMHHAKWLLFGVGEGHIAEQVEEIVKPFDCKPGYRVWYPYVEIKIYSSNEDHFNKMVPLIEEALSPYMIEDGKSTASNLLKKKLTTLQHPITIIDTATGGSLEATIKTPETSDKLFFITDHAKSSTEITIRIDGLENYWQHKPASHTTLEIISSKQNIITPNKFTIPYRGSRVKLYAVEFISQKILQYLA